MKSLILLLSLSAAFVNAQPTADLHALIAPTEQETKWLDVGWETDIVAAQQAATAQGKPIFLWQMDGHPLGCV